MMGNNMIDEQTGVHQELLEALATLPDRSADLPGQQDHWVTKAEFESCSQNIRSQWVPDFTFISEQAQDCPVEQYTVPVSNSEPDVKVYLVGEKSREPKPCIIHFHGGGFISGQAKDYIPLLQAQALALNCLIASVEYRLAPDTVFPGQLNDGYATLTWLNEQAQTLGIDITRIGVQGESAGGGLASMLTIAARDRAEFSICHQALIYPMLDNRTADFFDTAPFIGLYRWGPKVNRLGWQSILDGLKPNDNPPYGSVPARVKDLSNLPNTFIWVGGIDLFVLEDIEFAKQLTLQGNCVELITVPGVFHAFEGMAPTAKVTLHHRKDLLKSWCNAFDQTFDLKGLTLFYR